jgi:hypothetical protein
MVNVRTWQVFGAVITEGWGTVGGSPIPLTHGVARVDGVGVDGGERLRTHREGMASSGEAERGRRRRGSSPSLLPSLPGTPCRSSCNHKCGLGETSGAPA